jgi:hypothetical protein
MQKFSKRQVLIFVLWLLVGTALIGLGTAYVIQLKQWILPQHQTKAVTESDRLTDLTTARRTS